MKIVDVQILRVRSVDLDLQDRGSERWIDVVATIENDSSQTMDIVTSLSGVAYENETTTLTISCTGEPLGESEAVRIHEVGPQLQAVEPNGVVTLGVSVPLVLHQWHDDGSLGGGIQLVDTSRVRYIRFRVAARASDGPEGVQLSESRVSQLTAERTFNRTLPSEPS